MHLAPSNTSLRPSVPRLSIALAALGLLGAAAQAQVLLHEDFNDNSAGWVLESTWQIGPASSSGCATDPGSDADGIPGGGVAGNLIGNCNHPATTGHLVSPAIDASGASQLRLEYDRWLELFAPLGGGAVVDVWNGTSWVNLFTAGNVFFQTAWTHASHDITPHANPALRIRFGLSNGISWSMAGWSVDNVRITKGEFFHDRFNDNAAGWTLGPQWQIGNATASIGCATDVGFYDDPGLDADGTPGGGLAGAVIGGCTGGPGHAAYYLESPAIDTTTAQLLHLQFDRRLNSDCVPYQNSTVEVYNGSAWVTIFDTPWPQFVADSTWVRMTYAVTPYKNSAFRVRFGFDNTPASYDVGGWSVDNVSIFDASGCALAFGAYNGPGSIRVAAHCYTATIPAGATLFNCITLHAGSFPNGPFFGIDPSFPDEVVPEFVSGALPFVGVSGPFGTLTWDLPQGVPPGIAVYGVTLAIGPGGFLLGASPPTTFTTL
jgi:hypothetical protein